MHKVFLPCAPSLPPSLLCVFSRKACRSEADCSLLVCSPQAQVLVSAGFRRTFSTICHGCLSPCCAGTWHTHTHTHSLTHALACSNTVRCAAASVVMMECKGLGNSLAPGGISSLPNEMGMASVGPSRISAGRHVALERPCLHSTTYSLDIRAHTHARCTHINTAVHTDCMRVSVFEWLPGLRWCVCAHQDRNTCSCVCLDG